MQGKIERRETKIPECSNSTKEQQLLCSKEMENSTEVNFSISLLQGFK